MEDKINYFKECIENSRQIVFFGGAGVSTESGISDFRGAKGLFQKTPEELLSHDFFIRYPEEFFTFYRKNLLFKDIAPNITHKVLSEWEKDGKLLSIITQNIDGLHQMAGNKNVWELHGSVHRNYCMDCGEKYNLSEIISFPLVPLCPCGGIIRPDVVLYGEGLDSTVLNRVIQDLERADCCIVAGTSLKVYPAAGLIKYFQHPKKLFIINQGATYLDKEAAVVFDRKLGDIFSELRGQK